MLNGKYEKFDAMIRLDSQLRLYLAILASYVLLVFLTYLLFPMEQISMGQALPEDVQQSSAIFIGTVNALVALFGYGLLGLAGFWFARQLAMSGIYRPSAGWYAWFWSPLLIGALLGIVAIIIDQLFQSAAGSDASFAHPVFPLSVFASATAGIGEEIIFRGFILGLLAYIFHRLLRRRYGVWAFWLANIGAAILFAVGHIPSLMLILGLEQISEIPAWLIWEGLLLNGGLGIVAGMRYARDGLLAAIGIHFWFDIVWHVLGPAIGLA